jgi:hypothetical protein
MTRDPDQNLLHTQIADKSLTEAVPDPKESRDKRAALV